MIDSDNRFRFTKDNYKKVFPYSPMNFITLMTKPGAKQRLMKRENDYNITNFLYIEDIIYILEKGIKENRSPNRKHTEKWKIFLNNDIQEWLDNDHELKHNGT